MITFSASPIEMTIHCYLLRSNLWLAIYCCFLLFIHCLCHPLLFCCVFCDCLKKRCVCVKTEWMFCAVHIDCWPVKNKRKKSRFMRLFFWSLFFIIQKKFRLRVGVCKKTVVNVVSWKCEKKGGKTESRSNETYEWNKHYDHMRTC